MRNRRLISILLPLATIIWVIIFLKVIRHFRKSYNPNERCYDSLLYSSTKSEPVSLILNFNYSDPFLEHHRQSIAKEKSEVYEIRKFSTQNADINPIQWSSVTYGGRILNRNNKKDVYLIRINSKNYLLGIGEEIDLFQLKKAFKDSIIIRCKNEYKTIKKINK